MRNSSVNIVVREEKEEEEKVEKEVLHGRAHIHCSPWRTRTGAGEKCEQEGGREEMTWPELPLPFPPVPLLAGEERSLLSAVVKLSLGKG